MFVQEKEWQQQLGQECPRPSKEWDRILSVMGNLQKEFSLLVVLTSLSVVCLSSTLRSVLVWNIYMVTLVLFYIEMPTS